MLDWKYRPKHEREDAAQNAQPEQTADMPDVKPEGFTSRNVKVITFIITVSVLLVLFGPFSIIRLYQERQADRETTGIQMTVEDAIRLSGLRGSLTMRELQKYTGKVNENDYHVNYYVEFSHYLILGVEDKETGKLVTFTVTDMSSDASLDLLTGDARAFFEQTQK